MWYSERNVTMIQYTLKLNFDDKLKEKIESEKN